MKTNFSITTQRIALTVLILLFLLSLAWLLNLNYQAGSTTRELFPIALTLLLPLGLLFIPLYLWVVAWLQRREQGHIHERLAKFIHLAPRIAGILAIFFVSLFATDVFSGPASIWEKLLAFVIHASPAIVGAILLAFAWRRPWLGMLVFIAAAILFVFLTSRGSSFEFPSVLILSGPMLAVALLFWMDWKWIKPAVAPGK